MSRIFTILNALDEDDDGNLNFNTINIIVYTSSAIFLMIKTCNVLGLC
ncbi:putative ORfan [Saudi moumouvirus]|uniref:Uncharacterized protein n=1 Tax=Moumouvirus sp. 'Monve' TaxID=1128131 RepID=H2EF66_9VIRU|nr:hypothetical protein mv_R929 [Moumouvirus Monve]AQN68043.1 putative ORfan [Saudi moumouvirus]